LGVVHAEVVVQMVARPTMSAPPVGWLVDDGDGMAPGLPPHPGSDNNTGLSNPLESRVVLLINLSPVFAESSSATFLERKRKLRNKHCCWRYVIAVFS
jgi:hypothetical protein